MGPEFLSRYKDAFTDLTLQESNPGVCEIFRTFSDRPWDQPSLLFNEYQVFHRIERPGRGVDQPHTHKHTHTHTSSAEVKGRVELNLYFSYVSSCLIVG